MTTYRITPAKCIFTSAAGDHAFDLNSPGADALTVDSDAFLIATGGADGARLEAGGAWTVTVNGGVQSAQRSGLVLAAGGTAASTITIGVDGEIGGLWEGLRLESAATFVNHGLVASSGLVGIGVSVFGAGAHAITNTGVIDATISVRDQDGRSDDAVTNSGVMFGDMQLSGGADSIVNSGDISDRNGNDAIDLGAGLDRVVNTGRIDVDLYDFGGGADRVENSGQIIGNLALGDAGDTVINAGQIGETADSYVALNGGADRLENSGRIVGRVNLGDGDDVFLNSRTIDGVKIDGVVTGAVDMSLGDDSFVGGSNAELLLDNAGADTASLGGGDDAYRPAHYFVAGDGANVIDAGGGVDLYDGSLAVRSLRINLDGVAHAHPDTDRIAATTALGISVSGATTERITGFENASGGAAADVIHGSGAANTLRGLAGDDLLFGYGGRDRIDGGEGSDRIFGGAGRDDLSGGTGADDFVFLAVSDSGVGAAARDIILDFETSQDLIALDRLDANARTAADDAFRFIGANAVFTGQAGELRTLTTATGHLVQGDVDGDGLADFAIAVQDRAHAFMLSEAHFLL